MIKIGDVLIRFLPQFQVWHWGIVTDIYTYDLDGIYVMEFTDSDKIARVTLRAFCWYRKYFWVHTFRYEHQFYGNSVFRPMTERIQMANQLFNENILSYNMIKYNCEYFVRRCVFNDPTLWPSKQVQIIGQSSKLVFFKLMAAIVANTMTKMGELLELEKNNRPYDIRYEVNLDSKTFKIST